MESSKGSSCEKIYAHPTRIEGYLDENFLCSESEIIREVPDIPIETYDDISSSTNYFNKLVSDSGNSKKEGFTRHGLSY
jgi:hypothetical protein